MLPQIIALVTFCLPLSAIALPSGSSTRDLVFRQTATNPFAPLPGWNFVGCFSDNNPASRTLLEAHDQAAMTPELCTAFCSEVNPAFNFAGMEFGDECWCDFNIQGTAVQVNDTECNMPCTGDRTGSFTCGAASRISVYQNSNTGPLPANKCRVSAAGLTYVFDGCFTDVVGANPRTLTRRFDVDGGVTIENCVATCASNGFNITGLEFGQECWCGNSFTLPAANITAPLTDCSRACEADPSELCGAANRLSVYTFTPRGPSSTTVTIISNPTTISVAGSNSITSAVQTSSSNVIITSTSTSFKASTTAASSANTEAVAITSIIPSTAGSLGGTTLTGVTSLTLPFPIPSVMF